MFKNKITAAQTVRWVLVGLVFMLVTAYGVTWFEQKKVMDEKAADIAQLEATLAEMQLTAAALEADIEFSKTDAYIERLAREELGYVKAGEIKFVSAEGIAE